MSLVQPRHKWPAVDQRMWEVLCRDAGPLDQPGDLAHLRGTSRATLEIRYGRWMQWLATTDSDALSLPPADRATLPRLQDWLADLVHTAPMSRLMFVDGVLRVLKGFQPERDWKPQSRLLASLKRSAGLGDPKRKQGRVLSSSVLLLAGRNLAGPMADQASTPLNAMIGMAYLLWKM